MAQYTSAHFDDCAELTHLPIRPGHIATVIVRKKEIMNIEFLLTSLVVDASPGTGVLYTLAAGLSRGSRASIIAAFGCTLGIVPHMAAAVTGLATLVHASALAFHTLHRRGHDVLRFSAGWLCRIPGSASESAVCRSSALVGAWPDASRRFQSAGFG